MAQLIFFYINVIMHTSLAFITFYLDPSTPHTPSTILQLTIGYPLYHTP